MLVFITNYKKDVKGTVTPFMYNVKPFVDVVQEVWETDDIQILFLDNFDSVGSKLLKSGKKIDGLFVMASNPSKRFGFQIFKMLVERAKKVIGVFNEYGAYPFLQRYKNKWLLVLNFVVDGMIAKLGDELADKVIDKAWVCNLNVLKYKNWDGKFYTGGDSNVLFKDNILYYGSFRQNRSKYFKKYFCDERIVVSTSKKNIDKFVGLGCRARFIDKFRWDGNYCRELNKFKSSLYIEDVFTHKYFNFLANRWYECMVHAVPMFYDVSCIGNIEKAKKSINKFWLINNLDEAFKKINDKRFEDIKNEDLEKFKSEFFMERDKVMEQLYRIVKKLRDC
jgi:hypothetical protein